jgi:hypothetical protein
MVELIAPLVTAGVLLPLAAAAVVARLRDESRTRKIAVAAASLSLLLCLETLREVLAAGGALAGPLAGPLAEPWMPPAFRADSLGAMPMVLAAALALILLIVAPRRDLDRHFAAGILVLLASAVAAYAAANPWAANQG